MYVNNKNKLSFALTSEKSKCSTLTKSKEKMKIEKIHIKK